MDGRQYERDLEEMIKADALHMAQAIVDGAVREVKEFAEAIAGNAEELIKVRRENDGR